jgi:uncharacterized phage protein gp47/JayE
MSGSTGSATTSPTACWVDINGIHAPSYASILSYLQGQYQAIYGNDVILTNDSQDGQWLAIIATAINDANNATIQAYSNYSPATAQGIGLSSAVKINSLARLIPTNSTIPVVIGGGNQTNINNGLIEDANNNSWALPALVIIPASGTITVTATAVNQGAIAAPPQTFTISTPTQGWQTAIALTAAIPGAPVESDGALRIRQGLSTRNGAQTVTAGLAAALYAIPGVGRLNIGENDTSATLNGIPANSIAVVIEGGTTTAIGSLIVQNKSPGGNTYGSIEYSTTDTFGNTLNVYYSAPSEVTITVAINVLASTVPGGGYTTAIGAQIQAAVAAYIAALPIGQPIYLNRLMLPANLYGGAGSGTYDITSIQISSTGTGGLASNNITLAYNQAPTCTVANVSITAS